MNRVVSVFLGVLIVLMAVNLPVQAGNKLKKKLVGTWTAEAPDAPYGYQEVDIEFYKENGDLKVKMITDYDVIIGENVKVDGDQVTFDFEVENMLCTAKLDYKKNQLVGQVETPEGNIPVTMTKKKK